ncbi:hypothetical protein ElyMa_004524700 [Elysia marginata]|uniref:Uncharacterized protein n=1 Tax=Elysia marginata TaxID=1093978 RepID=A0AAV4HN33_9GAST|nr:hypothetical protein ElyMa_004524700 [Elysia marginata]
MDEDASLDLRRVNDAVNAVNNTVKRCVRGPEGTLYVLNQEGGTDRATLNATGEDLYHFYRNDVFEGDESVPGIMSNRFRDDMNLDLFEVENPLFRRGKQRRRDPRVTMSRSLIPGLRSLRATITALIIKAGVVTLTNAMLHSFFTARTCNDPKCLRSMYGDNIPPLLVRHPSWFYYPDEDTGDYLNKAVLYIQEFEKKPSSTECSLCARYHELADEMCNDDVSATLTLAGTPDEFEVNKKIMAMYSMHTIDNFFDFKELKLIKAGKDEGYVVEYSGVIYD